MITLKTLPSATAQQVFDQVATHLLTQNEESRKGERCLYRFGTLRCAAGCLIDDSEYDPSFENKCWRKLEEAGRIPSSHAELIRDIQELHDNKFPKDWISGLYEVAEKHDLGIEVVDSFAQRSNSDE